MKKILESYTKEQVKKASSIKGIFFDVDGVLTNGHIIYDDAGRELKHFNVKDGQIISYLKKAGIIIGAISGRDSAAVSRRCVELKVDFCHQGIVDKAVVFQKLVKHYQLKPKDVAFIGDDLNDLSTFRLCGLSACPADTFPYIKQSVDLVTRAAGGGGVLREVADLVLAARDQFESILSPEKLK